MNFLNVLPNRKDHFIGSLEAPVILVEYGDYECPHSAKSFAWMNLILDEFKKDVCFVFRHFPMGLIHPHSILAAFAAESAAIRNSFWEMHELLFKNYRNLSVESILEISEQLKFNNNTTTDEINRDAIINHIINDILSGEQSGVTSTPSYFLNGRQLEGPLNVEMLIQSIDNVLKGRMIPA